MSEAPPARWRHCVLAAVRALYRRRARIPNTWKHQTVEERVHARLDCRGHGQRPPRQSGTLILKE